MLYSFAKLAMHLGVGQFFSAVSLRGETRVESGPLMVVANHPNCALDPILVGTIYERDLWFMAKSTLFKGPFISAFLRALHMVPIYRKQDTSGGGAGGNDQSFRAAIQRLGSNGAVVIFPEGTSLGERRLSPLKTGTARIAFQAENEAGFGLGLRIQPIGITYTDIGRFRSSVTVNVGAPIDVSALKAAYEASPDDAVRSLTAQIEERLRTITVEIPDASHEDLVEKVNRLFQSRGKGGRDDFARMGVIARNVERLGPLYPQRKAELETRLDDYLRLLAVFDIHDNQPLRSAGPLPALCLLPFVAIGALVNYLPYRCTEIFVRRLSDHPATEASYKLIGGLVFYNLCYLALAFLIGWAINSVLAVVVFYLIFLACGYLANNNSQRVRLFLLSSFWPGRTNPIEVLNVIGDSLVQEMESVRVE